MEINDFIAHFAEQFEETALSSFTPETVFREIEEWNSLLALAVMAMVNEEYEVCLSATEMVNANTIQDLFDTVKSHL